MSQSSFPMDVNIPGEEKNGPRCEEPSPARFVVLRHDWPAPHRDFLLEWPGERGQERLSTWALYLKGAGTEAFPADRATSGRAVPLAPHRAAYLEYEGPVSGNRGHVSRECRGTVARAWRQNGTRSTIELRIADREGTIEGTLKIEPAAWGDKSLTIPVCPAHEEAAASGLVFSWEPAGSRRTDDSEGEAETPGR